MCFALASRAYRWLPSQNSAILHDAAWPHPSPNAGASHAAVLLLLKPDGPGTSAAVWPPPAILVTT